MAGAGWCWTKELIICHSYAVAIPKEWYELAKELWGASVGVLQKEACSVGGVYHDIYKDEVKKYG